MSSHDSSRSASGHLSSANGPLGNAPAGRQVPLSMSALLSQPTFGTQPLPAASLLAASGQAAPAPYYGSNGNGGSASYPSAYGSSQGSDYGENEAPYGGNSLSPLAATSAYGNPVYSPATGAAYGSSGNGSSGASNGNGTMSYALAPAPAPYSQSPSSYVQTPANGAALSAASSQTPAAYAPSGTAPALRNTQIYGQTLTNWQPALPVSPWGTNDKSPIIGGGVETETILRSDLKKLKRSRLKGWTYFVVLLGLAGTATYFSFSDRRRLVERRNEFQASYQRLESVHRETIARTQTAAVAPSTAPAGAAVANAAIANAATTKLADELKRTMTGVPAMSIDARGDRVVVALDTSALFSGREVDVGLGGYRTLYRLGKSLKGIKDRRVSITVPSAEMAKVKNVWALAAGRGVSLGRFFTDDLGFDRGRVLVSVPPPKLGLKGPNGKPVAVKVVPQGRIEFSLETI